MIELVGDSARGPAFALARLTVDGDRIVAADAPGLERPLEGLTLLEAAAVPGETLSPTQPFPLRPVALHPATLSAEDAFGFTPWDRARCRDAIAALLDADPALGGREGGPHRWEPLLYLVYARHDAALGEDATLVTARALLEHGADPNAGYLWHGLPSPFTALTGALGGGVQEEPRE